MAKSSGPGRRDVLAEWFAPILAALRDLDEREREADGRLF